MYKIIDKVLAKFKNAASLNARWQPYLYRLQHIFLVLTRGRCSAGEDRQTENFLFIVGCGRSGNTLLRRLLMERFDLYIPPETYVLPRQINHYYFSTLLTWPEKVDSTLCILENHHEFETFGVESFSEFKESAKRWNEERQSLPALITALYHWLGERNNITGSWVGDKTPLNTLNLGVLNWAFPNARFIYIERDPVDVVHSYVTSGLYDCPVDAADRWCRSLKSWERFKKTKNNRTLLEVRYEDLVAHPDAILDEVARKFSIPGRDGSKNIDPAILGDVGTRAHHSNVKSPPSIASIGKGRASISDNDLELIRKVLGDLPMKRGYQRL